MPSDTSTIPSFQASTPTSVGRLSSLQASFGSKSKEEILDQAHGHIKVLEVHLDKANRLAAIMKRIKDHCGLGLPFGKEPMLEAPSDFILKLNLSVDECLFGDRAVDLAFAKSADDGIAEAYECMKKGISTFNKFILDKQEAFPTELQNEIEIARSQLIDHPGDAQHADVPPLMASYDTSTDDEIRDKARGVIRVLEDLLCRAKTVALSSLPRLGTFIDDERLDIVICHLLDNGGHLALLRGYVDKLVHTKTAMTSFMASKFDRATSRLASYIKARISTLEKFAAPGDACPSGVGEEQSWDLAGLIKQCREDAKTDRPLIEMMLDYKTFVEVMSRLMASSILTGKVDEDLENNDGVLVDSLGRDFVGKVLKAVNDLVKADMSRLKHRSTSQGWILSEFV
ncbi:uncharacterized protein NECHADRAFT_85002 [Fusarium vanettenii 77-13-4]|uniref:Uncharacterized protein n=1 Tax=Fusarium vanettenii (strain ATCC MYA-4622 / CBS 123669 / FGSC 9596 / NRRL 45880 / 77-13-4) TaxID=660122 RepID=C7YUQ4_FUSV7|nr:uncharacterized protein NECHADRAFT_85002 [Fusarium vanettenii 77-13-4]EEU44845.1 predicted protein [Fusarium vanettenii 77-13-4]